MGIIEGEKCECKNCNSYSIKTGLCDLRNRTVNSASIPCDEFSIQKYFFCIENGHWVASEACLSRRAKNTCPNNCEQGKLIEKIYHFINTKPIFEED